MTQVVDEFVNERLAYYKKLKAEADALAGVKRGQILANGKAELTRDELSTLMIPNQVAQELAYGLDEAMAALKFYANAATWKEVPEHTYAAQDVGLKARVALARINPI